MLDQLPENTCVLLFAAGHGKRLQPLTDHTPKPLIEVGGKPLIVHHLERLRSMGFHHIVINVAYLGQQIMDRLGDGSTWGLHIEYSDERDSGALETAGGIVNALAKIRSPYFITINADIFTDFSFECLTQLPKSDAILVMVENPDHNPDGDFLLNDNGSLKHKNGDIETSNIDTNSYNITPKTFSGIARYRRRVFEELASGKRPLLPILKQLIDADRINGIPFYGRWTDVGTPERLEITNQRWSDFQTVRRQNQ